MTEQEMREMKAPWPKSWKELKEFVESLENEANDYGKAVYCMSLATTAMFNFMGEKVGASGFQASCADLDILRRTRHMDDFMIIDFNDMMYPQTNPVQKLKKALNERKESFAEKAEALLAKKDGWVAPEVEDHWRRLCFHGQMNDN